jgi:hypothetical protein
MGAEDDGARAAPTTARECAERLLVGVFGQVFGEAENVPYGTHAVDAAAALLEAYRDREVAEALENTTALAAMVYAAHSQLTRVEAERDAARVAVAEAGIVLEALWLAEHDGTALAPTTKAAIRDVLPKVRAALRADGATRDGPT